MFTAQATASRANEGYVVRTRHALLVFIRQPEGADYDLDNAIKTIADTGWEDVTLGKVIRLGIEPTVEDETLRDAHRAAAEKGSGIVVYAQPISAA